MAMIKSALELALERTKNLEVDEAAVAAAKVKTEARRAAGKFLEDPEAVDFASAIKAVPAEQRELYRRSAFDVLVAQIQLPGSFFDAEKTARLGEALVILATLAPQSPSLLNRAGTAGEAAGKKVAAMMQQVLAFLSKYQEEVKRVEQAIRSQWAPKLKEKERQMAARMGQDVRLDPMADPEFAAFYKQNVEALRTNYSDALERAKQELEVFCGFAAAEQE